MERRSGGDRGMGSEWGREGGMNSSCRGGQGRSVRKRVRLKETARRGMERERVREGLPI